MNVNATLDIDVDAQPLSDPSRYHGHSDLAEMLTKLT